MEENDDYKEILGKLKTMENSLRPDAEVLLEKSMEEIYRLLKDASITDEQRIVIEEKLVKIRKINSKNSNGATGPCAPKLLKK